MPGSPSHETQPLKHVSGAYQALFSDHIIVGDAAAQVTLPLAASVPEGKRITIIAAVGTTTVAAPATNTSLPSTLVDVTVGLSSAYVSDGVSKWFLST